MPHIVLLSSNNSRTIIKNGKKTELRKYRNKRQGVKKGVVKGGLGLKACNF